MRAPVIFWWRAPPPRVFARRCDGWATPSSSRKGPRDRSTASYSTAGTGRSGAPRATMARITGSPGEACAGRHEAPMRQGGIAAIAAVALTLWSAPRAADGRKLTLPPPGVKWSLRIDHPDFVLETRKAYRDFTQVWTAAQNRHTGVGLTVFIAKVGETRDAGSCRKYYLKRADQRAQVTTAERKGMALAERMLGTAAGGAGDRKDLHAYIYRDGFCIDLHLVKPHYKDDQKKLLFSVLDAVSLDPATEADRSETATYTISSGPGEDLTIDAARSLRDRNFAAADALLARPCPWATGKPPDEETFATADCGLRSSGAAEARADKNAEDLARMYWRAGGRGRRGGGWAAP